MNYTAFLDIKNFPSSSMSINKIGCTNSYYISKIVYILIMLILIRVYQIFLKKYIIVLNKSNNMKKNFAFRMQHSKF